MASVRVYQLAKNLGYDSRTFVEELAREGIVVKSHMSTVDDETAELVMALFSQEALQEEKEAPVSKPEKKTSTKPKAKKPEKASASGLEDVEPKEESTASPATQDATVQASIAPEDTAVDNQPVAEKEKVSADKQTVLDKATPAPDDKDSTSPTSPQIARDVSKEKLPHRHGGRVRIAETITVKELAEKINVKATEVIKELMKKGQMTTINQMIDHNTATNISETFGYEVEISKDNCS